MFANVVLFDGALMSLAASSHTDPEFVKLLGSRYPMAPDDSLISGRVVLTKACVHLDNALADPSFDRALAVAGNSPTFLGHRLWEETRVALFKQAVDDREHSTHLVLVGQSLAGLFGKVRLRIRCRQALERGSKRVPAPFRLPRVPDAEQAGKVRQRT